MCFVLGCVAAPAAFAQDVVPRDGTSASIAADNTADDWPPVIPTSAFAKRSMLRDAVLSPDGDRLAIKTTIRGRDVIAVFDAATKEMTHTLDTSAAGWLNWIQWAGNDRILYSVLGNSHSKPQKFLLTGRWATSLMGYDLPTRTTRFVGFEKQGFEGDDILYTDPAGAYVILSMAHDVGDDPHVYRYPLDGRGAAGVERVQERRKGIDEWWADDAGVVRLGARWRNKTDYAFFYRGSAQEDWAEVTKVHRDASDELDNWDMLSLRAGSDMGYALVRNAEGRKVLRQFDYRSGAPGDVVFAHPTREVTGVELAQDGTLMAAHYVDGAPGTHWFDAGLRDLERQLTGALGTGRVRLTSFDNGRRLLVWHGDADDPGAIYIYTPATKALDLFDEFRPEIDFAQLAGMQAVTFTARDGTPIESFLTLPKGGPKTDLPLILLPHGGPYGIQDMQVYNDEVQLLANRGYAVLQPNFRGSGGYGDRFEKLGEGQIGRKMQDDLDDAMDWAVAQGFANPERVCVVGGSYGGFAALWSVIRNPERYRCAASWAGVTDFDAQLKYDRDFLERRVRKRWQAQVEGDLSTMRLSEISPTKQIARLTRPVLLAHGTRDARVPFDQFELFRDAAKKHGKPIDTLVLEGQGHSFDNAGSEQAWYDALLAFLQKNNPADRPAEEPAPRSAPETSDEPGVIRRRTQ